MGKGIWRYLKFGKDKAKYYLSSFKNYFEFYTFYTMSSFLALTIIFAPFASLANMRYLISINDNEDTSIFKSYKSIDTPKSFWNLVASEFITGFYLFAKYALILFIPLVIFITIMYQCYESDKIVIFIAAYICLSILLTVFLVIFLFDAYKYVAIPYIVEKRPNLKPTKVIDCSKKCLENSERKNLILMGIILGVLFELISIVYLTIIVLFTAIHPIVGLLVTIVGCIGYIYIIPQIILTFNIAQINVFKDTIILPLDDSENDMDLNYLLDFDVNENDMLQDSNSVDEKILDNEENWEWKKN